jgi:hypothetical protein
MAHLQRWRADRSVGIVSGRAPIEGSRVCGRFWQPKEDFVRTFSAKLLAYAISRGLDYRDAPAVRGIGATRRRPIIPGHR